jgi:hypothetical protein
MTTVRLHHRVGFAAVATVLLLIVAMLPFAVGSAVTSIVQPSLFRLYNLTPPSTPPAPTHSRLNISLIGLEQWSGLLTLRVSGTHVRNPQCDRDDRFVVRLTDTTATFTESLENRVFFHVDPGTNRVGSLEIFRLSGTTPKSTRHWSELRGSLPAVLMVTRRVDSGRRQRDKDPYRLRSLRGMLSVASKAVPECGSRRIPLIPAKGRCHWAAIRTRLQIAPVRLRLTREQRVRFFEMTTICSAVHQRRWPGRKTPGRCCRTSRTCLR